VVIRRFDVLRNPSSASNKIFPYLLVVQSEFLNDLPTRVIVPLTRTKTIKGPPVTLLNPEFEVEGLGVIMLTQQIANVPLSALRAPVASLEPQRDAIVRALDFLFNGI
jgi:toxin CcdB